jgi:Oxidoreductase family, NAD-binding Rossmann fold
MPSIAFPRRGFLKVCAAAAASVATPRVLRAGASPNEKLNLVFVGAGGRGASLIPSFGQEANLLAFCDVDETYAANTYKAYPQVPRYTDYRKMFDALERQIDTVVVATPDQHHYPASMMALRRGKHVYCEKPLTYTSLRPTSICASSCERVGIVRSLDLESRANSLGTSNITAQLWRAMPRGSQTGGT